ncbi:ABC transporter substrate-binding protein [Paenibacillus sepulcri]|uniref:Sugar ABC transporter substrate-binding protein n=1 Tax=Paenibacillus sepulcri TaxID=359917 RepID=A0ABS7BZA5_9BACL|nr:sugar ABC transporter substrate-binding protein [Paenibacillus sepulcri]
MKKGFAIVLALCIVISLSACGSGNGNNTANGNAPAGENTGNTPSDANAGGAKGSITFAFWGAQSEADAINNVVSNFEEKNPDIKVEKQWIQRDYLTKLQTMIAGGTAPDVILISGGDLPGFANAFQEMQVDTSVFSSPSLVESMTYEGKVYAAPFIIKPKVMAVNVDLFEKNNIPLPSKTEPMTTDQFKELSQKLTSGEGKTKVFGSEPLWLGNWIYSFGGSYYSEDNTKSTIDSPESISAAEYIVQTKQSGNVPNDTEKQGQDMMNWFLGGRIGMYTDFGPWYLPQMAAVEGFNWDIYPIPGGGGSKEVDGLAIGKTSKNAEAAQVFVNYLTQNDEAQKIIGGNKNAYGIPVIASATASFESIYPEKNLNAFVQAAEKQHNQEAQKRTSEINNEMKMIDDLTPIGIGKQDVKEVFPKLAENINKILQQN